MVSKRLKFNSYFVPNSCGQMIYLSAIVLPLSYRLLQLNSARGLRGPRKKVSTKITPNGGECFDLQIVDNTGDTLNLVANGAGHIL